MINSYRVGRNININSPIVPLNSARDFRFQAFSLGVTNGSEGHHRSVQKDDSSSLTRNITVPTATWNSILTPSSPAISTEHTEMTAVDRLRIATFVGCAISAFLAIILKSSPGSWRFFLAGGICATISHTIPTPVDVVKTRKQVDPRLVDHSFLEAGRYIVKEEGFSALWAGLGPTTFGYLLEGAIKFGVYEILKPALKCWLSRIASISSLLTFFEFAICSLFLQRNFFWFGSFTRFMPHGGFKNKIGCRAKLYIWWLDTGGV